MSGRQWGNVLCLQAAIRDPDLGRFINREQLKTLSNKTIKFLSMVAHASSALNTDLKILIYSTGKLGLLSSDINASFSSTSDETKRFPDTKVITLEFAAI